MITCSEAVRRLWEYLDGAVDPSQRDAIEDHLKFCRRCCGELEFAAELRRILAESADVEIPDEVCARLTATLDDLECP